MHRWHSLYLGLGSNLGRRRAVLAKAVEQLDAMGSCRVRRLSSLYETEPEGAGSNWYLNLVVSMETTLDPEEFLARILDMEKLLGRNRSRPWPDRTMDIDILLWENKVITENHLVVPHPRLHQRLFVLVPLAELDPETMHPVLHISATQMLHRAPPARIRAVGTLEGSVSRA